MGTAFASLLTVPGIVGAIVSAEGRMTALVEREGQAPLALLLPQGWVDTDDAARALGSVAYVALSQPEWVPAPAHLGHHFASPLFAGCEHAVVDSDPDLPPPRARVN